MIRITERDQEIIDFLVQVKCADTQTISNIFFNGKLRATQLRLKALSDYKYIKYYRENVISPNVYYIKRKPTQIKHSLILSKFIGTLYAAGIEVIKYKVPLKIGNVIADAFICIRYGGDIKIFLVEVENAKYFNTEKYIKLKESGAWKEKLPLMPPIIVITDKKVRTDPTLDIITLKTDLSNLENLLIKF